MNDILYFKLIGARAHQEKINHNIDCQFPVAVSYKNSILDCDEKAFKIGIRPGDTIRQAKLASPSCCTIPVYDAASTHLKEVLNILAANTPFVEPDDSGCGVFAGLHPTAPSVLDIIASLKNVCYIAIVSKSRSKFLSKSSSDFMMRTVLEKHKITASEKPWGYIKTGPNYVLAEVKHGSEGTFLAGLPVSSLWPLPDDLVSHLYTLGLKSLKDLQQIETSRLATQIGDWAYKVSDWVKGLDNLPVKSLYPAPYIEKTINFYGISIDLVFQALEPSLKEAAEEMAQSSVGFKHLTITLLGDFGNLSVEKRLVRPIRRFEPLQFIVSKMLEELFGQLNLDDPYPTLKALMTFKEIDRAPAKQVPLIRTAPKPEEHIPVSLKLALTGIEQKYGHSILSWGIEDKGKQNNILKPEILRREKILAYWDPVRFGKTQIPTS